MGNFNEIIKGAMDAEQGAVEAVKNNPKTASALGGAAVGAGLVGQDNSSIIEEMRERGYSDTEILDYLQQRELDKIQSENREM